LLAIVHEAENNKKFLYKGVEATLRRVVAAGQKALPELEERSCWGRGAALWGAFLGMVFKRSNQGSGLKTRILFSVLVLASVLVNMALVV
jgi:hypothetical protein